MSPQRAQRRAAWAMVAGVVGIAALILSVWLVGVRAADNVHDSEARARAAQSERDARARTAQTAQLRAGCARGVARDFESLQTNRDLWTLAHDASNARRESGDIALSRRYGRTADRARFRMQRIRLRLPAREDEATITAYCRVLYPEPTPDAG